MNLFEMTSKMDQFDTDYETEIMELERDIPKFAKAYYEENALISDMEFDQLVDRLRELKPDSTILHTPGWGYKQTGSKLRHKYQLVKSLDKCKTYDEIPERFKNKEVMLSPKLDGLTGVFYYKDGRLVNAITRGDGQEGKDITDKAILIVGTEIKDKSFTGAVRGELEISEENWEKIKDKYPDAKNARNLCAGWINSKEYNPEEIQMIDFVTYKVNGQERPEGKENIFYDLGDTICLNSDPLKSDVIDWLNYNFSHVIPNAAGIIPKDGFDDFMTRVFNEFKKEGYVLDGIVISAKDVVYDRKSYSYIYDECAFKFPSEEVPTVIKDINWTLTRTMRMVPVLNVEAVNLAGATIENVTGNNAKYLIDNGLGKGAEITICRSNEVIPKHMSTIQPTDVELPKVCPVCNSNLSWVGVDLKCINSECAGADYLDLKRWCEVIGETDGFAWLLMKQYLDGFNIKNLANLYDRRAEIDNYFYSHSQSLSITDNKAVQFFNKLFKEEVDIEKALLALNIPRLGDKTTKELSRNIELSKRLVDYMVRQDTTQTEFATLYDGLLNVVKEATTTSIFENQTKLANLRYIYTRIKFKDVSNKEIIKVAVTGALETMKRSAFEKYIESYGYELSSAIKSCRYLITNTPDSGSSKNKDAKKYGVEIITERDFLALLGDTQNKSPLFG